MLPIPLTSVWSSSARLTPLVLLRSRVTKASSSNSGSSGSRAMCAIVEGSSAPPATTSRPAEGPLVDEAQLPAAVGEGEPDPQVGLERLVGRYDEQLTAHPEVPGEGVAGVQRQPEVLAAAAGAEHGAPDQHVGEVLRAGQVPTYRPGVMDLDAGDRAAGDACLQAEADDLDLGQLRH